MAPFPPYVGGVRGSYVDLVLLRWVFVAVMLMRMFNKGI